MLAFESSISADNNHSDGTGCVVEYHRPLELVGRLKTR